MSKETKLAWGCITIIRSFPKRADLKTAARYTLMIKVSMGDRKAVYALKRIFGIGSVKFYPAPNQQVNSHYSWTVQSWKALSVVEAAYPYLVIKRKEADVARAFMRLRTWQVGGSHGNSKIPAWLTRKRDSLHWRMRKLKPRWRFYEAKRRCNAQD